MAELIFYSVLLIVATGHAVAAAKMYRAVNFDQSLRFKEKNDWKLKALVFPAFFWWQYQKEKKRPD
jgi:hypothetical protein